MRGTCGQEKFLPSSQIHPMLGKWAASHLFRFYTPRLFLLFLSTLHGKVNPKRPPQSVLAKKSRILGPAINGWTLAM